MSRSRDPSGSSTAEPWRQDGSDVLLAIKAVPGASRTRIAGRLNDRLKVCISAAPEDGKANQAIRELLARGLGVRVRQVTIESGARHTEKIVRLADITRAAVEQRFGSL